MRSISEDPAAFYAPDVLDGLDPDLWDATVDAWEQASLALGATIRGRLSGAVLGLAPDRHRWRALVVVSGSGVLLSSEAWRDPSRCLLAARARLAADVVEEAKVWRAVKGLGLDHGDLHQMVIQLLDEPGSRASLHLDTTEDEPSEGAAGPPTGTP